MSYVTREGGATVTVIVPYDCNNNCPFCINKFEYKDTSKFNLDEVIRSIRIMSVMTPNCDFVFTGGEPLADLDSLSKMLYEVHQPNTNHKVFINTTLPVTKEIDEQKLANNLNFWYKYGIVTGINVSRHLRKYVQECDDKIFSMLKFEPRINCVLYNMDLLDKELDTKLINFVKRFKEITGYIQFRKDYAVTTPENLYDEENDEILNKLKSTFNYKGPFGQYRMRCGYEFEYENYRITYHKTLPYSKLLLDNGDYVLYDIIIKQTGEIRDDWDVCTNVTLSNRVTDKLADKLDLTAYKEVTYEKYI